MSTYKSGRHGQIRSAHTGTKGSNSITLKYGNGRSDTFFGAPKGQPPIGRGHGHTARYGFPVHSRQPGNRKRQQKSAWDLFYRI